MLPFFENRERDKGKTESLLASLVGLNQNKICYRPMLREQPLCQLRRDAFCMQDNQDLVLLCVKCVQKQLGLPYMCLFSLFFSPISYGSGWPKGGAWAVGVRVSRYWIVLMIWVGDHLRRLRRVGIRLTRQLRRLPRGVEVIHV